MNWGIARGVCKFKSLEKSGSGGEGKVPMPLLNSFSDFKKKKMLLLKEVSQLDFQSDFKKENIVKVKLEKL